MHPDQRYKRLLDYPIDHGIRELTPNIARHRKIVDDIAERRRLDEKYAFQCVPDACNGGRYASASRRDEVQSRRSDQAARRSLLESVCKVLIIKRSCPFPWSLSPRMRRRR